MSRPRVPEHQPLTGGMRPFIEKPRLATCGWVLFPRMRPLVLMIGHDRGRFGTYGGHLRAGGLRLITASNPSEAVRLVNAVRPAVCIIDVWSLRETGWDICEALRATRVSKSTPMLVMANATGAAQRTVKARARHLNCTILPRTLSRDDFVDFVFAVIGLSRRVDQRSDTSVTSAGTVLGAHATEDD
jgi:DNA-binding NtrC family response regulator